MPMRVRAKLYLPSPIRELASHSPNRSGYSSVSIGLTRPARAKQAAPVSVYPLRSTSWKLTAVACRWKVKLGTAQSFPSRYHSRIELARVLKHSRSFYLVAMPPIYPAPLEKELCALGERG